MKKLIIVCEERLHRYGDFLAQLISGNDDLDGRIVGIKDGSTAAQVWTEKEYASNAAQISSEQYLLFIGNTKLIKEKRHHMLSKYSEHGMNYGWLGKQAVLFVDHQLSFDEYGSFYELMSNSYAEGRQNEAVRLLPSKIESPGESVDTIVDDIDTSDITVSNPAEDKDSDEKKDMKIFAPFVFVGKVFQKAIDDGTKAINKVSNDISASSKSRDIEDQQYTCAVLLFYLNDLAVFLGLDKG